MRVVREMAAEFGPTVASIDDGCWVAAVGDWAWFISPRELRDMIREYRILREQWWRELDATLEEA